MARTVAGRRTWTGWWRSAARLALFAAAAVLAVPRFDREIAFYDEGIYVATAKALAMGLGYRNPSLPDAPAQAKYPPLFPLVLSGVWRAAPAFPANLIAMRIIVLLSGLVLLGLSDRILRRHLGLSELEAGVAVAMFAVSPMFLVFTTLITTDVPYAMLSVGALYMYEESVSRRSSGRFVAAILLAALALLTRTVGIFLFAAMCIDLWLSRRPGRAITCALVGAAVLVPWSIWSEAANAAYAQYPIAVRSNYVGYTSAISGTSSLADIPRVLSVNLTLFLYAWNTPLLPWLPARLGSLAILAVMATVLLAWRQRPGALALYGVLYLVAVLIVPYPDTPRYELPLAPFLVALIVVGVRRAFATPAKRRSARIGLATLAGALAIVAFAVNVRAGWRASREQRPDAFVAFHQMLDWVDRNLPADSILVGDFDPAYYLFTGRRAVRLSVQDNMGTYYSAEVTNDFPHAAELSDWFRRLGACHVISDPMIGGREHIYFSNLIEVLRRTTPGGFRTLYTDRDGAFAIYEQSGCP
jgi:dolichyl-phosphate-mannose-protein mannosyltransferase